MNEEIPKQFNLFEIPSENDEAWQGMPEYVQEKTEYHCIKVSFKTKEAMRQMAAFIGQNIDIKTKTIHYPFKMDQSASGKTYDDES